MLVVQVVEVSHVLEELLAVVEELAVVVGPEVVVGLAASPD